MTIDKAIEIMRDLLGEGPSFPPDDRRDAVKLSIEALDCIRAWRQSLPLDNPQLLPGETKQ